MADPTRKRTTDFATRQLITTLKQAQYDAGVTQAELNTLKPFFQILISKIHEEWEKLDMDDGASAKLLKFRLMVVRDLEKAMIQGINKGKKAAHQLETLDE